MDVSRNCMESDLAWARTHTLTSSPSEVVDRQQPIQSSLPVRGLPPARAPRPPSRWRRPGRSAPRAPAPCAAVLGRFGPWAPLSQRTIVGAEGLEPPACSKDVPAPGHG
jgi:hypothetical protein